MRVHASLDGENVTETEKEISTAIANMIINDRSTDEASRILELVNLKVIAAKIGQSVVLYIYCKTIEDLQQLHDSLISGRLKDLVELWFNSLLIRSQKTKLVALTTDDEEFQKMRTYFRGQNLFPVQLIYVGLFVKHCRFLVHVAQSRPKSILNNLSIH